MGSRLELWSDPEQFEDYFKDITSFEKKQSSNFHHFLRRCIETQYVPDKHLTIKLLGLYVNWFNELTNSWFAKRKKYSADHLINFAFKTTIPQKDFKNWANCQLQVIEITLRDSCDLLTNIEDKDTDVYFGEIKLLSRLVGESYAFLDIAAQMITGKPAGINAGRRYLMSSIEAFDGSRMLVRRHIIFKRIGEFSIVQSSAFLIRQSLELRLKNIWGIDWIEDSNGDSKRIPYTIISEYMKKNIDEIEIPVDLHIYDKIFKWANSTIHMGWTPYIWSIVFAQKLIEPLFTWGTHDKTQSIYGAVKIKKNVYDDIEEVIKNALHKEGITDPKIHKMKSPEAFII